MSEETKTKKSKEEKLNIYKILNKIQNELKAPKSNYNSFGKYNYRSCEDILEGVKPLLSKYGAILTIKDDMVILGDRYYVKAIARLSLNNDDFIETYAYARESETKKGMDDSQVTGATSSYARKYALNGLFCIDDTKEVDTMDNSFKSISTDQLKTLEVLGVDKTALCKYFKVNNINELSYEQGKQAISMKKK